MTRLDQHLVAKGDARSRERAREAIIAGRVTVNGKVATKPATRTREGDDVVCTGEVHDWVGRGALKLVAALDAFGMDPSSAVCLDLGASTGGFTEVLLSRGARRVYAVDVGHGQLAAPLARDGRVVNLERTHARDLNEALVPEPIDLLVCDVSFISLKKALPPTLPLCGDGAAGVVLVKPQFEVGPSGIGKNGIVKLAEDELRAWLTDEILPWFTACGWVVTDHMPSPITGGDGNLEFLVGLQRG